MSVVNKDAALEQQGIPPSVCLIARGTAGKPICSPGPYSNQKYRAVLLPSCTSFQAIESEWMAFPGGSLDTSIYIFSRKGQRGESFMVIPKHFVPPMLVNALLGTVLWTTYAEASSILEPYLGSSPTIVAVLSGAVAGGTQALIAAPAENVRLVLEGASGGHGWSHAWKEVFRGTAAPPFSTKKQNMEEIRQVRIWMKEVGDMAGRGWDGWGWGCAKDMCGFATFFSIFDITRRVASKAKIASQDLAQNVTSGNDGGESLRRHFPRTIHGVTLVTGGVVAGLAYELVSRPWDIARRTVQINRLTQPHNACSTTSVLIGKYRNDGVMSFFRNPVAVPQEHTTSSTKSRRRLYGALRTLGRVGPWGMGFLVWEAYGSGLS